MALTGNCGRRTAPFTLFNGAKMNIDIDAWKDLLLDRELRALEQAKFMRSIIQERDALEKERNDLQNQLNDLKAK